ncbi:TetR/AcrR family transcriptional regulator [Streptomyces sp. NPDC015220]|uniref:TetR/AcrR family transcriptional regulator n=1 Tax=Streptomyces sp. NPDC015220 TaxID=3364947 RepID=UPI0036FC40B7
MSPRGVATPDARERLYAAAEALLTEEGPHAVTTRAVAERAGCSKGVFHNYFTGVDEFLAELVLDRMRRLVQLVTAVTDRAGQNTVAENLLDITLVMTTPPFPAIARTALLRPAATDRIRTALHGGEAGYTAVQHTIAQYMAAERALGRIPSGTDTDTAALALVGTLHHLLMSHSVDEEELRSTLRRLIALITDERP